MLFQSLDPSSFPNTGALKVVYTNWKKKTKLWLEPWFLINKNFCIIEGSFLGLDNCLKKKRNEIPVFQINMLHISINPVSWKTTCFHFLSHSRAWTLIHFSRDSTGNRIDCGIKIFIYTFVVIQRWSYFWASSQTIQGWKHHNLNGC